MPDTSSPPRAPHIWEALSAILVLVVSISSAIVFYETDPHIAMLLGVVAAAIVGLRCGYKWATIQDGMIAGIANSLQAVIILMIIGILIGLWILSGVVPSLLYYGLLVLEPEIFLPTALIICAITSLATGTSWGTTGTIGVALMGIGAGLGFPLPIVAGACLSGAYFGDKMSPLSDTTNLAPAMAGTDLYTHIRHMMYTTGVAFGLTLVIEIALGFQYGGSDADVAQVKQILETLDKHFFINPVFLIPPVLVIVAAYRRVPAIPGIVAGAVVAALLGLALQGNTFEQVLNVAFGGYTSETGVKAVDKLLSKGA